MAPPTTTPDQVPAITVTVEENTLSTPKRERDTEDNTHSSSSKPEKKHRRRRNRQYRGGRQRRSTLKCSREQRNRHRKGPESFDVEATLRNGTVLVVTLTKTESGWKDSIREIVYFAPYTDIKRDVYTRVCSEYVNAEEIETVLEWMKTDFSQVRLLTSGGNDRTGDGEWVLA